MDALRCAILTLLLVASTQPTVCGQASNQNSTTVAEIVPFIDRMEGSQPQDRTMTLVAQSDAPLPTALETEIALEIEQSRVFGDERVNWIDASKIVSRQEFQDLVIVRFHGACRLHLWQRPAPSTGPLGWVEKVDGQILSIVHVDCARIAESVVRALAAPHSADPNEAYSHAIARVIRHELRHVLLNSSSHDRTGENKASLRPDELIAPDACQSLLLTSSDDQPRNGALASPARNRR